METIENKKVKENSSDVLAKATLQTINDINEFVEFNEYSLSDKIKIESGLLTSKETTIRGKIDQMTLNQRKKYKRIMNKFITKRSLQAANRFLHFLYKKVLASETRITIKYSERQLKIAAAREKYVVARKAMIEAYNTYKEEKGDFFRSRLSKKQKV